MLRKIGIIVLTVTVAAVVFGCSNDAITPAGSGSASSTPPDQIKGRCWKGIPPHISYPYQGVHVWCDYDSTYSNSGGWYYLDMIEQPPQWMWIYAQVGNLTPIQSEYYYYPGGDATGPDFYFP